MGHVRSVILAASILGAGLAGGALGAGAYASWLPDSHALAGTTVDGYVPPRGTALLPWLEKCRNEWLAREAYLHTGEETIPFSFVELGLELDVDATHAEIVEHAMRGTLWQRLQRAWSARQGHERLMPVWKFDVGRARPLLEALQSRVAREPVDARLDLRAHRRIEDVPGLRLDVAETLESIAHGPRDDGTVFEAVIRTLPAKVTSSMLVDVDVDRVLSSYSTSFRGKAGARAINIAVAARYLSGTLIAPGETLSFNAVVGPRSEERGFVSAPVIVEDEIEKGLGGGVCQVATTLHAAAVYGLLDVVQRRSHSRPSGYAPLGLDATVIEDEVDLKLRNPYEVPLMIHAFLPDRLTLRVELLGRQAPGKVEHHYSVVETHPFSRRVKRMADVPAGKPEQKQKGNPGYEVVSVVSVVTPEGRRIRNRYRSKYYPVPEVFWTSMDEPLDSLPPPPEGSVGVDVFLPGQDEPPEPGAESRRVADPSPDPYEQAHWRRGRE